MADHLVIVALAVGGLVAFLIYKGVLSAREAKAEKLRGLRALGFEPLDSLPDDDAAAVLDLRDKKKIKNVFERRGSAHRLYLLDLESSSDDSSHHETIAVFSSRLRLPSLTIFPRIGGDGRLAGLGNLLLKKLAQRRGRTLDLPAHPRFAQWHFVSGPDEDALRRFLTTDRLDRLAALEHMVVDGKSGVFTYQRVHFGKQKGRIHRDQIAEHLQQAEEVLRALGG
jgi:hypothetical protein